MSFRGRDKERQLDKVVQPRDDSPVRERLVRALEEEGVTSAIYFDNSEKHLEEVGESCKNILLVHVNESKEVPGIDIDESPALRDLVYELGANRYIQTLRQKHRSIALKYDDPESAKVRVKYDVLSGINETQLEQLSYWLRQSRSIPGQKAVIFDWDRTLTKTEGIPDAEKQLLKEQEAGQNVTAELRALREDMLKFVCGGVERLQALRHSFSIINSYGAKIIVLTNNGACGKKRQFEEWVKQLFYPIPIRIVCSRPFQGDKGKTLVADRSFKMICVSH